MSKPRSSFSVARCVFTDNLLFIIDRDEGGMSVTNDAEAVCAHCHELYPGRRIIYRDTEGEWSELVHENGKFTGYAPYKGDHP